jgi:hypothetical protein
MTLVERGGRARSVKIENLTSKSLRDVLVVNASRKSALHTDELSAYVEPGREFASHETVNILRNNIPNAGGGARRSLPTPSKAISQSSSAG